MSPQYLSPYYDHRDDLQGFSNQVLNSAQDNFEQIIFEADQLLDEATGTSSGPDIAAVRSDFSRVAKRGAQAPELQ